MKIEYQYLILAVICFLLVWLIGCSRPEDENEMSIMNTVKIDGIRCYSYIDGLECKFIPVPEKHNDNIARVEE